MPPKIEARKVIVGAVMLVAANRRPLFKALLAPVLIGGTLIALLDLWNHPIWSKSAYVFQFFVNAVIAIVTHRIIILGPEAVSPWGICRWTSRESEFTAYLFGLSSCGLAFVALLFVPKLLFPAVASGLMLTLVWILAMIGTGLWVISRLSLVFPAIAIDEKISFGSSWQLTKPIQRTTAIVVLALPFLLGVIVKLVGQKTVIASVASSIVGIFAIVLEIAALSLLYREVYRNLHGRYPAFKSSG